MNVMPRSNIFRVVASEFRPGICSVCGLSVIIRFRDVSTGFLLGDCCVNFAIVAERHLSQVDRLRAPAPIDNIPNH